MEATLSTGLHAVIDPGGTSLSILDGSGAAIATIPPPVHAEFYQFAEHAIHGVCPIVSFELGHTVNGWPDWYYLVSPDGKRIERLNPWR